MDGVMRIQEDDSPCLWVCPFPIAPEQEFFQVLVRTPAGAEAVYFCHGPKFVQVPLSEDGISAVLSSALKQEDRDIELWANLLTLQAQRLTEDSVVKDIQEVLKSQKLPKISKLQWEAIVLEWVKRDENIEFLREFARVFTTNTLHESQHLLDKMVGVVGAAEQHVKDQAARQSKDHERALRKFRKDLDLYKLSRDGAHQRAERLQVEVARLNTHIRTLAAASPSRPAQGNALGLALDAYFPAEPSQRS
jgi:hypothetical protein